MWNFSVSELLTAAGHAPLLEAIAIVAGTFVLEDAATVLAAMQVADGQVGWEVALGALYVGIVLGDIGLYGLGRLAALVPWARRWVPPERYIVSRRWVDRRVVRVVFVSRFLPGARLPTYTACGFLAVDFLRFTLAAVGATLIWTSLLFTLSLRVGHWVIAHLGAWRWAGAIGFLVVIMVLGRIAAQLQVKESDP